MDALTRSRGTSPAPAEPRRATASGVRVAVVGCGPWGQNHVRNYAEIGALSALVDPHEDRVAALAAEFGGCPATLDAAVAALRARQGSLGGRQTRVPREAAGAEGRGGGGALHPRRAARPAPHGRAHPAVPSGVPEAARPRTRGPARTAAIYLFEPPQPRKDPARGGHPVVPRPTRRIDDPFARRHRAGEGRGRRRLFPAPDDRRRDDDAPDFPRRRAGAHLRIVAPPV